ncbi:collagen triple helix repeat-containing protein 1-like [Clytia hemisphaerica]
MEKTIFYVALYTTMVALAYTQVLNEGECNSSCKLGRDGRDGRDGIDGKDGKQGPAGKPGKNGADGIDGINGVDGKDGKDGINGNDGKDCQMGMRGRDGLNGTDGKDGMDGKDGKDGLNGIDGIDGLNGTNGRDGIDGKDGLNGSNGIDGKDGINGANGMKGKDSPKRNWKECAWDKINSELDEGLLKTCTFRKKSIETYLRVEVISNLRIYNCDNCCSRWFVTFNGQECTPVPIDGIVYMKYGKGDREKNLHRPQVITGRCKISKIGHINVGFNIGECAEKNTADAFTGWQQATRIYVEEIEGPQSDVIP